MLKQQLSLFQPYFNVEGRHVLAGFQPFSIKRCINVVSTLKQQLTLFQPYFNVEGRSCAGWDNYIYIYICICNCNKHVTKAEQIIYHTFKYSTFKFIELIKHFSYFKEGGKKN